MSVISSTTEWDAILRRHVGLEPPIERLSPDEAESKEKAFSQSLSESEPADACRHLAVEEFRCLLTVDGSVDKKATSCFRWFNEWRKCAWDQHKFNEGLTYIEGPQIRKPYLFAPNYQYA